MIPFFPHQITEKTRRFQRFAQKWGLVDASYIKRFRFDEFYTKSQKETFFRDLFSSPQVGTPFLLQGDVF